MRNLHWKQFIIAGIALLVSCSGSGEGNLVPLDDFIYPAFIPYIEEIQAPSTVSTGEFFNVTFRVSAELNPSVLLGRSIEDLHIFSDGGGSSSSIYKDEYIYFLAGGGSGTLRYEYIVPIVVYQPGLTELRIYSAPSRETGGMDAKYVIGQGSRFIRPAVDSPSLTYQSVMVTVEPAEE